MEITRRNIIFGAGALALVPLVPIILSNNIPQYVTFPSSMWKKQYDRQAWRHITQWRVQHYPKLGTHQMFALGCEIPYPVRDVARILRRYNKVLENVRIKHDFDEEMIYRAANTPYTIQWSKDGKRRCGNNEYCKIHPIAA